MSFLHNYVLVFLIAGLNIRSEIQRSAMKCLLSLAVTNVRYKCNGIWYVQSDGLPMDAPLDVILAILLRKSFEALLL